jgi:hypothetical protein
MTKQETSQLASTTQRRNSVGCLDPEMVSKLTVIHFVMHQVEHFLVLTEYVIEFKLHRMSNMEKYLKYCMLSFYPQYVPVLLSIMLNGPIEGKITLK